MSTFSERLQDCRRKNGLSSKDMADKLNITLRAYQFYEQGKREPSYDKLVILARELKVTTDYLLGLSEKLT